MSQHKDPNQGEGDRISARRYDKRVRQFIDEGNVPDAADDARLLGERDRDAAAKEEAAGKRGPKSGRFASVDEIVAAGHSVIERVRPMVRRAVGNLRKRFGK